MTNADWALDMVFYADMLLNFWTGYDTGYMIVMDKASVRFCSRLLTFSRVCSSQFLLTLPCVWCSDREELHQDSLPNRSARHGRVGSARQNFTMPADDLHG